MFEKKYVPEVNYDAMYGKEILKSLERIEDLNDNSRKAEREVELRALEWESDVSSAKRELSMMKKEMNMIKERISEIKTRFTSIVGELRITSSNEDMEKLSSRIDNFDFASLITREDFKKLISK
jgi:predicted  nucleic acid-binding Zn-ribbon protein